MPGRLRQHWGAVSWAERGPGWERSWGERGGDGKKEDKGKAGRCRMQLRPFNEVSRLAADAELAARVSFSFGIHYPFSRLPLSPFSSASPSSPPSLSFSLSCSPATPKCPPSDFHRHGRLCRGVNVIRWIQRRLRDETNETTAGQGSKSCYSSTSEGGELSAYPPLLRGYA